MPKSVDQLIEEDKRRKKKFVDATSDAGVGPVLPEGKKPRKKRPEGFLDSVRRRLFGKVS